MSKKDEALKLALETSEGIVNADWRKWDELASPSEFERWAKSRANFMATILREALAEQPAQQEPVEWGVDWGPDGNSVSIIKRLADGGIEVVGWEYAPHPPQRTWVGLTDEDKHYLNEVLNLQGRFPVIDAIEARLKEKNT